MAFENINGRHFPLFPHNVWDVNLLILVEVQRMEERKFGQNLAMNAGTNHQRRTHAHCGEESHQPDIRIKAQKGGGPNRMGKCQYGGNENMKRESEVHHG